MTDQTTFRAALTDATLPRPDGLLDGTGAPAGRRFDVYRNNVAVSLSDALATAFPVLVKLVGAANFATLAATYRQAHPPASPLLMFYGDQMPDFLATFEPTAKIGYLPDIARLEIALRESYHAADAEPLPQDQIAAIPPDRLVAATLTLAPSLRLVRSKWPIHAIWAFNTQGGPKPVMEAQDTVILRPEFDPAPHALPQSGGAMLAALLGGATLGQAMEPADAPDLPALLSLLIGHGAIIGVTP